jgi:hypothetical protein
MAAALASAAPIHTPASPFSELLRRSRFAKYDPAIRQAYRTPSANAHRGDWGLKRPITLRRHNAFISINGPFESRAQFIEWNRAENEVRFIRRMKEMDIKPRLLHDTPWDKALGLAKYQLLLDSEFCPGEGYEIDEEAERDRQKKTMTIDLPGLGNRGAGRYGAGRGPPTTAKESTAQESSSGQITENIEAMSTKKFQRYLRKLRKLRPAFAEYIQQQKHMHRKSLYQIAQKHEDIHHRRFLQQQTANEFSSQKTTKVKIEQQPHPNAGLMYACPSPLDTHFHTKPKPGFILNAIPRENWRYGRTSQEETFVASLGGLTATLPKSNSGGKRPLLDVDSETGIDKTRIDESIANMRPTDIVLVAPPKVVGRAPQGLNGVQLETLVTAKEVEFANDNPYQPGSVEYNACPPPERAGRREYLPRWGGARAAQALYAPMNLAKGPNETSPLDFLNKLRNIVGGPPDGSARDL